MKTNFCTVFIIGGMVLNTANLHAQTNTFPSTGAAGIGTTSPDPSSLLEVVSTSKGILIPRMTQTQRNAIVTPSTGLLIFQTNNTPGFYYYNGSTWTTISPAGANKTLNNLTSPTAVNRSLIPGTTNSIDLGSPSILWRNAYFSGDALINGITVGVGGGAKSTNTANGFQALFSNTTGGSNTATGNKALFSNTTGSFNTAYGLRALYFNTTGSGNVAIGIRSLYSNTSSSNSVAVGDSALYNNGIGATLSIYGSDNTGIGSKVLFNNTTGFYNVAIGSQALYSDTSGSINTAIGYQALYSNLVGHNNIANGYQALYSNTTGGTNIAIGREALYFNTTGDQNIAYGYRALESNTTGSFNICLGSQSNVASNNLSNATALGFATIVNASNKVVIGNENVSVVGGQVGWSTFSDGRFKTNIKENVPGLDFINKLKPVTYNLELKKFEKFLGRKDSIINIIGDYTAGEKKIRTGFVAQDVEKAAQEIGYDFDGVNHPQNEKDNYSLVYADFVPSLVKAVQELSKQNDELRTEIEQLKAMMITNHSIVSNEQSAIISSAALQQNIPNPFNHTTTINYTLPQQYSSAKIIIIDKSGKVLKEVSINAKGNGSLQLDASTLSSGAYQYSLYVDGRLIDTKQMVLAK